MSLSVLDEQRAMDGGKKLHGQKNSLVTDFHYIKKPPPKCELEIKY